MGRSSDSNLAVLNVARRTLAQAKTVEEVKELRDKAEAARKYARCARMGLQTQNECAEFKLSCERKAGKLLIELGMGPGRPGRRKRSHHATILSDLGINKSQSSRWQMEARVPEEVLQLYVATTRENGKEITAQGLLRLARKCGSGQAAACIDRFASNRGRDLPETACLAREPYSQGALAGNSFPEEALELIREVLAQHKLLWDNLQEFCEQEVVRPMLIQRRTVARVLREASESLETVLGMLHVKLGARGAPCNHPENTVAKSRHGDILAALPSSRRETAVDAS